MVKTYETELRGFRVRTAVVDHKEWEIYAENKVSNFVVRMWGYKHDTKGEKAKELHEKAVAFIRRGLWLAPSLAKVQQYVAKEVRNYPEWHK